MEGMGKFREENRERKERNVQVRESSGGRKGSGRRESGIVGNLREEIRGKEKKERKEGKIMGGMGGKGKVTNGREGKGKKEK